MNSWNSKKSTRCILWCNVVSLWCVGPWCATFTCCWKKADSSPGLKGLINTNLNIFLISKNRPYNCLTMFSQPIFKCFEMVYMGRHNQSSLHFLTSSDKTFFYDQNTLTRQETKVATRFSVFMIIESGISPPTFSQFKNFPGYIGTAEWGHAPKQP